MNYDFLKEIPGALSKPEPRCVTKRRLEKVDAKNERACREIVRARDGGKCRIPGCLERSAEAHHIVYRSKSKARRWDPSNLVSLCRDHHRLEHAHIIQISGNADEEIIVTGDVDRLRFRL
jgi:5-methylcytosine-specific restriction endonuclease McrA